MWVPININQQVSGLNFRDPPDINYNCQQCKFVLALRISDTFETSFNWLKRKLIQFLSKYLFLGLEKVLENWYIFHHCQLQISLSRLLDQSNAQD